MRCLLWRQIIPREEASGRLLKAKSWQPRCCGHTHHHLYLFRQQQKLTSLSVKQAVIQAWYSQNAMQLMPLNLYFSSSFIKSSANSSAWLSMPSPSNFTIFYSISHPDSNKTRLLASSWKSPCLCCLAFVRVVLQIRLIAVIIHSSICWVLTGCRAPRDDFPCISLFNSHNNLWGKDIEQLIIA